VVNPVVHLPRSPVAANTSIMAMPEVLAWFTMTIKNQARSVM